MIKKISRHASSSKVTNLNEVLISLISTIVCRIVLGRRYEEEGSEGSRFHKLFNECEAMLGNFFVSDYIPFMGWIDKLRGLDARLERNFKEMDKFYQEAIDEHMNSKKKTPEEEDLVDVLLQLKENNTFPIDLTNDNIKAVLLVWISFPFLFFILCILAKIVGFIIFLFPKLFKIYILVFNLNFDQSKF